MIEEKDEMKSFKAKDCTIKVGGKIKMCSERTRYTVQAFNDRFIVATKPHFDTYLYTLIDRKNQIRGSLNSIFGLPFDVDTPEGASSLLNVWMQEEGGYDVWHVSRRNNLPLTKKEIEMLSCKRKETAND